MRVGADLNCNVMINLSLQKVNRVLVLSSVGYWQPGSVSRLAVGPQGVNCQSMVAHCALC
jgi:hypothetical protein